MSNDAAMADRHGEIIDDRKVICPCKGIKKKTFKGLIKSGERSLDSLLRKTGATTGDCKGRRCAPRVEEMLRFWPG
ncbi:MAG: (2Fe-2S)-binding protein [Candidatus Nitrospinota bacterium M3_3B_026]